MGPSLISDGNAPWKVRGVAWVRGFNGAVADQRRKSAASAARSAAWSDASMGPSLISDGNEPGWKDGDRNEYASMGPSLISDGNDRG